MAIQLSWLQFNRRFFGRGCCFQSFFFVVVLWKLCHNVNWVNSNTWIELYSFWFLHPAWLQPTTSHGKPDDILVIIIKIWRVWLFRHCNKLVATHFFPPLCCCYHHHQQQQHIRAPPSTSSIRLASSWILLTSVYAWKCALQTSKQLQKVINYNRICLLTATVLNANYIYMAGISITRYSDKTKEPTRWLNSRHIQVVKH